MKIKPSPATLKSFENTRWRFKDLTEQNGDCQIWTGATNGSGTRRYGLIRRAGHRWMAHHVAFFYEHGRWPRGAIEWTCGKTLCMNPAQLREVEVPAAPGREGEVPRAQLVQEIVDLRLRCRGLGSQTIHARLQERHAQVPSIPTILRICEQAGLGPKDKYSDPSFQRARAEKERRDAAAASKRARARSRELHELVLEGDPEALATVRTARPKIWRAMIEKARKARDGCWIYKPWKEGSQPTVWAGDRSYAVPTGVLLVSGRITDQEARDHEYMRMDDPTGGRQLPVDLSAGELLLPPAALDLARDPPAARGRP